MNRKISRLIRLDNSVESQEIAAKESLNGILFHTAIKGADWISTTGFYPGGWAADFRLLTVLFRILNDFYPGRILEFGMGETTRMFSAYITNLRPDAVCLTVEHDQKWQEFFSRGGDHTKGVKILNVTMEPSNILGTTSNYYTDLDDKLGSEKNFDLVVIDGPIGSPRHSRHNMCDIIRDGRLADEFILLLDDAGRPGEQDTIRMAEKLFHEKGIEFESAYIQGAKKIIYAAFSTRFSFLRSI